MLCEGFGDGQIIYNAAIYQNLVAMSYEVDMVVHLLKCLPNLENLFVEMMILTPNEKLLSYIVQHSLHLKNLVLHFVCNGYTLCLGMFFYYYTYIRI